MDVVGDHGALQRLHLGDQRVRDGDAVGAALLGDGDGDGGCALGVDLVGLGRGAGEILYEALRFAGAFDDLGDLAHVDGRAVVHADDQALDVARMLQEAAGVDLEVGAAALDGADVAAVVGGGNGLRQLRHRDAVAFQTLGHHLDADLLGPAACDERLRRVLYRLQALQHFERDQTQGGVVEFLRPQREGRGRHVVDATRLDHRLRHAGRDLFEVRRQLVVELDERRLHLLADHELHGDHAAAAIGRRVDVLDARNFRKHALERIGGERRHLLGRGAGEAEHHVHHRHRDLRILLARRDDETEQADQQQCDQE